MSLEHVKRCPAPLANGVCNSAVFYDWGLQLMETRPTTSVKGEHITKLKDYAVDQQIKICARCNTPYILEAGDFIDISDELSPEEVQAIIKRGQANLPHVKIKDP